MSFLDSVIGTISNSEAGGNGLQDIIGMAKSNPKLLEAVTSLLCNDGGAGGLDGLATKFQQAGLGNLIDSWIGSGPNQVVSSNQLSNALGSDVLSGLATKFGLDKNELTGQLSSMLPMLVDKLTPNGQSPAEGLGNASDLIGVFGGLLKR